MARSLSLTQVVYLSLSLSRSPPLSPDPVGGTINVKNASASVSGTYRCRAKNLVGSEECILQLSVTPRKDPPLPLYPSLISPPPTPDLTEHPPRGPPARRFGWPVV